MMNNKQVTTVLALPILGALSFNNAAFAGDYEGYLDRLNSWEERYGSPVEFKRYNRDGSYDTRQVFFMDSGRGHHIEFDDSERWSGYTGHLLSYGTEDGELFSYEFEDMLHIKMDEGVACTEDMRSAVSAHFSVSASAQDLSDLAISPEEANDLYRRVFYQSLQEQVLIFERDINEGDSHDVRNDQMVAAFDRALEVSRGKMERDYGITISKREPITTIRSRTVDGFVLKECENRKRSLGM
jgi:hypothetical protein